MAQNQRANQVKKSGIMTSDSRWPVAHRHGLHSGCVCRLVGVGTVGPFTWTHASDYLKNYMINYKAKCV